jgi:hypothetical protein
MYLENAEREAFSGFHEDERRMNLTSCIFCPFRNDDICIAYQQVLEDNSKKPSYCRYKALIIGGDE